MRHRRRRSGAAAVEFALTAVILLLLLFGAFEFCRYLMVRQVLTAAAREGARYALVHSTDSNVDTVSIARVRQTMAGVDRTAFGTPATVAVYAANNTGVSIGATADAKFGQPICVRVQGDYRFMLPAVLGLPSTSRMDVKCLVRSEQP